MIKKIILKNFQSHANTELKLSNGVNVIVGKSDVGKSSIFRALYWLVFNRPAGDGFRSHWGGDTMVQVDLGEGISVKRFRTDQQNGYDWSGNKTETIFRSNAVGGSVPPEIQSLLNMDQINFANQMDAPFLLSMHPAEAGRYLNDIIGLDIIDDAISYLNKVEFKERNTVNGLRLQIKKDTEELSKYEGLDDLIALDERIEQKQAWVDDCTARIDRLQSLFDEVNRIKAQIEPLLKLIETEESLNSLLDKSQELEEKTEHYLRLASLVDDARETEEDIKQKTDQLEAEKVVFKNTMPEVCPLCGQINRSQNIEQTALI